MYVCVCVCGGGVGGGGVWGGGGWGGWGGVCVRRYGWACGLSWGPPTQCQRVGGGYVCVCVCVWVGGVCLYGVQYASVGGGYGGMCGIGYVCVCMCCVGCMVWGVCCICGVVWYVVWCACVCVCVCVVWGVKGCGVVCGVCDVESVCVILSVCV